MITYDDLLAARYLNKRFPNLTNQLQTIVEKLVATSHNSNLLHELIGEGMITKRIAWEIYDLTMTNNRKRALKLFLHLLNSEANISPNVIRQALAKFPDRVDALKVGNDLVSGGHLTKDFERSLRYRTRIAFDRFRGQQLEAFLSKIAKPVERKQTVEVPGILAEEELQKLAETRFKSSQMISREISAAPTADAEEDPELILSQTLDDEAGLRAPKFPIPDWVDLSADLVDKEIGGFRFLGLIGEGAMGRVYLCEWDKSEEPVAVKLLAKGADEEAIERFKREVFIQAVIPSHPNIIDLFDAGVLETGQHYLALEFFDSTDLFKILQQVNKLDANRTVSILLDLCSALKVSHEAGVVHRDLKPSNILVSNEGNGAKLADYGISLSLETEGLDQFVYRSMVGTVTGTAEFVSPEQAFGGDIDQRSDLYSLGVVMYLMLSGKLPFESETRMGYFTAHMMEDPTPLKEVCAGEDIPEILFEINAKLLEKEPSDRIQSAQELAEALQKVPFKKKETKPLKSFFRRLGLGS